MEQENNQVEIETSQEPETEKESVKKELTPTQLKRKYRTIQYSTMVSEYFAIAAPFVTIGIVNYDKYFVQYDGVKMSIALYMALAVMGFAIWAITKKKLENSFVTLVIGWAVFAFIFTMMGEMISDLATIMWFGLIGLASAFGLDEVSKSYKKKKNLIIEAEKKAEQDKLVDDVKKERAIKKVKIKVKR